MSKDASVYSKLLVIRFPAELSERPVISQAVKLFDLDFNILRANVVAGKEGMLVLELRGHRRNFEEAMIFLQQKGLQVKSVGQEVWRDEERCFHCGACTAVCPTQALYLERPAMTVAFNHDKCMACEMCVTACPPRAMRVGRHEPVQPTLTAV